MMICIKHLTQRLKQAEARQDRDSKEVWGRGQMWPEEKANRRWEVPAANGFSAITSIRGVTRSNQCLGKNELAI